MPRGCTNAPLSRSTGTIVGSDNAALDTTSAAGVTGITCGMPAYRLKSTDNALQGAVGFDPADRLSIASKQQPRTFSMCDLRHGHADKLVFDSKVTPILTAASLRFGREPQTCSAASVRHSLELLLLYACRRRAD